MIVTVTDTSYFHTQIFLNIFRISRCILKYRFQEMKLRQHSVKHVSPIWYIFNLESDPSCGKTITNLYEIVDVTGVSDMTGRGFV